MTSNENEFYAGLEPLAVEEVTVLYPEAVRGLRKSGAQVVFAINARDKLIELRVHVTKDYVIVRSTNTYNPYLGWLGGSGASWTHLPDRFKPYITDL